MTAVLIPVKPLAAGKSRLAPVLSPADRQALVLAMLDDLLRALARTGLRAPVRVIGSDGAVRNCAARHGAAFVPEPDPQGYNAAVRRGLAPCPDGPVAVFPADLPLASPDELAAFLTPPDPGQRLVRLASDSRRAGTNGLYLSAPGLVAPCFGQNSFEAHRIGARRAGAKVEIVPAPGLARDIDRPEDLRALSELAIGATRALMAAPGVAWAPDAPDRGADQPGRLALSEKASGSHGLSGQAYMPPGAGVRIECGVAARYLERALGVHGIRVSQKDL